MLLWVYTSDNLPEVINLEGYNETKEAKMASRVPISCVAFVHN